MKRIYAKIFDMFFYLLLGALLVGLIIFPKQVSQVVMDTCVLCFNVILPSLFPFFVFASLIINSGLASLIGRSFGGIMKFVFGLPGSSGIAFFLGILSGYPVGANTAISLYKAGECSKSEAERLLAFCNNTGPAFILGSVGLGIWKNSQVGILLYVCQIAASIITGILFRFYKGSDEKNIKRKTKKNTAMNKTDIIVHSIKSSAQNVFYICAFIVFFAVVIELLSQFKVIPAISSLLASLLPFSKSANELANYLVKGFFEVTTGTKLAGEGSALAPLRLAVTGAILSWAGLSVHCQVLSFLSGSGLSVYPYILGKFIQAIIGAVITYIAAIFYPFQIPVMNTGSIPLKNLEILTFSKTLYYSAIVLFSCMLFFALSFLCTILKNSGKQRKVKL